MKQRSRAGESCWADCGNNKQNFELLLTQVEQFGGPPPAAAGAPLADLAAGAAAIADIFLQKGFANKVPTCLPPHAAARSGSARRQLLHTQTPCV